MSRRRRVGYRVLQQEPGGPDASSEWSSKYGVGNKAVPRLTHIIRALKRTAGKRKGRIESRSILKALISSTGKVTKDYSPDDIVRFFLDVGIILIEDSTTGRRAVYWHDPKKACEVLKIVEDSGSLVKLMRRDIDARIAELKTQFEVNTPSVTPDVPVAGGASANDQPTTGSGDAGSEEMDMGNSRDTSKYRYCTEDEAKHPPALGVVLTELSRVALEGAAFASAEGVRQVIARETVLDIESDEVTDYIDFLRRSSVILDLDHDSGGIRCLVFSAGHARMAVFSMMVGKAIPDISRADLTARAEEVLRYKKIDLDELIGESPKTTQRSVAPVPVPTPAKVAVALATAPVEAQPPVSLAPSSENTYRSERVAAMRCRLQQIEESGVRLAKLTRHLETLESAHGAIVTLKEDRGDATYAALETVNLAMGAVQDAEANLSAATKRHKSEQESLADASAEVRKSEQEIDQLRNKYTSLVLSDQDQAEKDLLVSGLRPEMLDMMFGLE